MAKKEPPPPKGCPAWQGTFADLMNLLLCFFVLLYAMSSVDAAKFEEIAASFSTAFGIFKGGDTSFGDGALVGDGVSQLTELSNYVTSMGVSQSGSTSNESTNTTGTMESDSNGGEGDATMTVEGTTGEATAISDATTEEALENATAEELAEALEDAQMEASAEMAEEIEEAMVEEQIDDVFELNYTGQYVQLTLQGAILFDSGQATLKEDVLPILNKAGTILERYDGGTIEIEGHTDNVPISSAKFANNDELSDARALSVFYYICENTSLDPANIKHAGRGEYDPIADNSTPEGRARNRRVEIRIYNPLSPMY